MKHISRTKLTFLVFLASFVFYLPFLGSYGLFDPWETHYSEVSRTMVQRNDYISTFWQDNGFYSKPVLTFWLQAGGLKAAGLNSNHGDDAEMANSQRAEWATRVPVVFIGALAIASLFLLISIFFGGRAGFISAALLAVTPHFALVARQTITDMPFVGFISMAMACFLYGYLGKENKDEGVKFWKRTIPLIISFLIMLIVGAQYLLFGSNVDASFVHSQRRIQVSGFLVFLPYLIITLDALISSARHKSSTQKYFILLGFVFSGLGILAKGFGALFIPGAVFLIYFLITGEWERLKRFDLLRGIFLVIAVSFPWHHAMIIRHGGAFFQEYIVHHHFKRAAMGVHGERGIFTYYLNQMLFGLFPLLLILPATLVSSLRVKPSSDKDRLRLLLLIWAVVSFFLFSFMLTKFHHYILPAAVPLAILSGLFLNDLFDKKFVISKGIYIAGLVLFVFAARELYLDPSHMVTLFIYKYARLFPYEYGFSTPIAVISVLIAIGGFLLMFVKPKISVPLYLSFSLLFTGYIIYDYMPKVGPHWSQKKLHEIYYSCRNDPSERFIAYQLNWRGENFYSKNKVIPYMKTDNVKFFAYLERYRTKQNRDGFARRYLIMESKKRYDKLKTLLNKKFYSKWPEIYKNKTSNDLVHIIGPGCKIIPEVWETHFRQKNYKVLKAKYPHNKFMLIRIEI
jgi:4-amino-4-deoxy-L-arabinose transferase-like glycosyltransferase